MTLRSAVDETTIETQASTLEGTSTFHNGGADDSVSSSSHSSSSSSSSDSDDEEESRPANVKQRDDHYDEGEEFEDEDEVDPVVPEPSVLEGDRERRQQSRVPVDIFVTHNNDCPDLQSMAESTDGMYCAEAIPRAPTLPSRVPALELNKRQLKGQDSNKRKPEERKIDEIELMQAKSAIRLFEKQATHELNLTHTDKRHQKIQDNKDRRITTTALNHPKIGPVINNQLASGGKSHMNGHFDGSQLLSLLVSELFA